MHRSEIFPPMSVQGHFRPSSAGFAYRPLPLSPKSGHSASARFMRFRARLFLLAFDQRALRRRHSVRCAAITALTRKKAGGPAGGPPDAFSGGARQGYALRLGQADDMLAPLGQRIPALGKALEGIIAPGHARQLMGEQQFDRLPIGPDRW